MTIKEPAGPEREESEYMDADEGREGLEEAGLMERVKTVKERRNKR